MTYFIRDSHVLENYCSEVENETAVDQIITMIF